VASAAFAIKAAAESAPSERAIFSADTTTLYLVVEVCVVFVRRGTAE
jgi:hypothetical protein